MNLKKLLITTLILMSGFTAFAEEDTVEAMVQDRFVVGFKIAPSVSWMSSNADYASGDGSVLKFNWGFAAKYNFTDNYALVSGFNVNGLGGELVYENEGYKIKAENKFRAFEIPLAFRLTTEPFGFFVGYVQAGFGVNYVFNSKTDNRDFIDQLDKKNIKDAVNRFMLGYHIAIGAEHQIAERTWLTMQVLYNGGITSLLKDDKYRVGGDRVSGRHNFVEFGVGILF